MRRVGWDVVDAADAGRERSRAADPDDVCVLAYTSGTTSDPKGVMHSHRTLLAELLHMRPWITPGAPNLMGSPVTHATGMLGAVLAPMELGEDIHLIDRWDPTRVLEVMLDADIGAGTGASVFLASILDHPDFTPEHAGASAASASAARRCRVALARARRGARHRDHPRLRIDRAPVDHRQPFDDPADKRHGTDGAPMPGVEIRLVDDDGDAVAAGRRRRDLVARPRPVPRLHRSRAHRRTRSTTTAGTAPATWACSTPTASSRSPTA